MNILPINYRGKIISGERTETFKQDKESRVALGKTVKVKVLDYLGGGKLIIDFNGQRMVATSDIVIEKGREILVKVINIGEGKVILQLIPDELLTSKLEPNEYENLNLVDEIKNLSQLIWSLKASSDKESFISRIEDLLQNIPLRFDMKTDFEKITEQIHDSIIMLGYTYEHDLARSIREHGFFKDEKPVLKAELLKLLLLIQQDELKSGDLKEELKGSIEELLRKIEYQQLRSILEGKMFVDLPIILGDQETSAELEFFAYKGYKQDENESFNISIRFDLETIGYVEFIISVADKDISCQIKANRHDTYIKIKRQLNILEKRFTALGYNTIGIFCSKNTQRIYSLDTKC